MKKNGISTTRYNIITFIPKNLFEQFRRLSNAFFLFLVILSFIPQISALQPISTIIALAVVLLIKAIKDAVDDVVRFLHMLFLFDIIRCFFHREDIEVIGKLIIGKRKC